VTCTSGEQRFIKAPTMKDRPPCGCWRREVVVELRKSSRFRLQLGVTFRWQDTTGEDFLGTGDTRDISAAGMFILSHACPPRNAQLSCEVIVPRSRSAGSLQIKTEGKVIRVEPGDLSRLSGFAVCGDMQVSDAVSDWLGYSDARRI
jgi:hypothetical protein